MKEKYIRIDQPVSNDEFAELVGAAHEAVQEQAASYCAIFKKEGVEKQRVAFCKTRAILDQTVTELTNDGYEVVIAFEVHTKQ